MSEMHEIDLTDICRRVLDGPGGVLRAGIQHVRILGHDGLADGMLAAYEHVCSNYERVIAKQTGECMRLRAELREFNRMHGHEQVGCTRAPDVDAVCPDSFSTTK